MSVLFLPFDGTSRVTGTKLGCQQIAQKISRAYSTHSLTLLEPIDNNSYDFCKRIATHMGRHRLTFGGEHLVTLPLLEKLQYQYQNLRLVVFDAHHDAYCYPLATHYSVFYYAAHELGIPIFYLGLRYEIEKAAIQLNFSSPEEIMRISANALIEKIKLFIDESPFYLSFDCDVLDPTEFSAIGAPVKNGITIEKANVLLKKILELSPIACDFVEYNSSCDTKGEQLNRIWPLVDHLLKWECNNVQS